MRGDPLSLHHEVLLLALRDDKGTLHGSVHSGLALGGAVLAELLLRERVRVIEPKKNKKLVEIVSNTGVGDPLLDECLQRIAGAKRRGSPQTWVTRFSGLKNLKGRVAQDLCRRGILREDEDRVLMLFRRKIYPEVDPRPERAILERMHRAIFSDTTKVEPRTVVLVSLVKATDILPRLFDKKQLKERKARLQSLVEGEVIGKAAQDAVQAAHAVILATTAAVTATTITTSR